MSQRKRKHAERSTPAEPGDDIIALRIVNSTRKQYEGTLARLARWVEKEHPECIQHGEIVLPISVSLCKVFLTYSSYKRNRAGVELVPQRFNSNAAISGVLSAIKYLYTERPQTLDHELETMMNVDGKSRAHDGQCTCCHPGPLVDPAKKPFLLQVGVPEGKGVRLVEPTSTSKDFATRADQANFSKAKKVMLALLETSRRSEQEVTATDDCAIDTSARQMQALWANVVLEI
ncbi:hypothetical protein H257_06732 [Aphanomyces astaci]|uniref:Uncharacterized protein n=1 Tax=Aphanomyces astaci TaxID=112090 RepID=W4GM62_APHAT|nr:hypothetical protein H257_06732 [Aphanomyces astaci]ETV80461.1 hypothetical protein H257_06732 [Aphanomyces astaci]|eukprot:XP_009830385.1 hypothetical protein H257_06732 [Aphanomyces astaci]